MIKFYKMMSGEEIVAEVDNDGSWTEQLEMTNPCRHMQTQQGPMIVRYPCDSVVVAIHHILFCGKANDELSSAYRQIIGGIVTPQRKLQVPQ